MMQFDYSLAAKWLELLKQIAPATRRVGIVRDAHTSSGIGQFAVLQSVSGTFGFEIFPIGTNDVAEIDAGIAKLVAAPNAGLVGTVAASVNVFRDHIIALAGRHRLPAVYANRAFVDRGGLASYGSDTVAASRRATIYVDRILRGEKPADLPVQAPNKYELVVNLKTAKALGFDLPAALLARADEVIE
jgi:putative ABC transport system substrate-binding protein